MSESGRQIRQLKVEFFLDLQLLGREFNDGINAKPRIQQCVELNSSRCMECLYVASAARESSRPIGLNSRQNLLRNRTFPALLGMSICVAVFSYGFAASQFRFFPYGWIRGAHLALSALIGSNTPAEVNGLVEYRMNVSKSTVVPHSGHSPGGLLLMCAGNNALKEQYPEGVLAWILNRNGEVVHVWKVVPGLWTDLTRVTRVPGISGAINPVGLHLFDNGDLLATFHGFNTFPFAVGIARVDREGKLLWKKELLTHHSFSVAADGRIFVPALEVNDAPIPIGKTNSRIESESGKVYHDLIMVLDANGNEMKRISIKDALFDSGWHGHLLRFNQQTVVTDDPFHLNDVQLVGEHAIELPGIACDDLLVSLRNINTLGILDPLTAKFKWISSGATVGQHSPRIVGGGVVVLDNLGGEQRLGGTQLVKIDFRTGLPSTLFPRSVADMPDLCRTVNSGHLEISADGRYALMTLTHQGAAWEIDLESGQVVWEYIHMQHDELGKPQRILGSARYIGHPTFLKDSPGWE